MVAQSLNSEAATLYEYGSDRGSNVHLIALIIVRRKLLDAASSDDERGIAHDNLGIALWTLGERESGTARLEEAVAAYREALKEWTRERVPLNGPRRRTISALRYRALGERESGTARLEEAVAAYRDGAEGKDARARAARLGHDAEQSRHCVMEARRARERHGAAGGGGRGLSRRAEGMDARARAADWAMTQNNLGNALASARRARERHGAAGGGGRRLSRRAGGMDARARAAPMGHDPEQSRRCVMEARRARERDGAAGGGGRRLSRRR